MRRISTPHGLRYALVVVLLLVVIVIWSTIGRALSNSISQYRKLTATDVARVFSSHQADFESLKDMIVQDAEALRRERIWVGPDRDGMRRRGLSPARQDAYLAVMDDLPILDVQGGTDRVVFVFARFGMAGDMRGKGLQWTRHGSEEAPHKRRETVKITNGWAFLHYW